MEREEAVRERALIKEELQDLLAYLDGLPPPLKRNGAFASYEQRAAELSRELMLSEMLRLAPPLGSDAGCGASAPYDAWRAALLDAEQRYERATRRFWLATRVMHGAIVVASVGSVVAAFTLSGLQAVPLAVSTAVLGALVGFVSESARKTQRRAELLTALRNEVAHSLGPRGELLGPAEYYPASTRRVEQLLDDIQRESVWGDVAVRGA